MKVVASYLKISFFSSLLLISCDQIPVIPVGSGTPEITNTTETPGNTGISLNDKLTLATPQGYTVKKNQSYGPSERQVYDVYSPVLSTNDKGNKSISVVMVHGGGWSLLDKSYLDGVVEIFKQKNLNITIFNINYRLPISDGVVFSDIMQDFDRFFSVHQSLKFEYNLDEEVVLWGYSSGGHLALIYSYKYPKTYIKAVAAVVAPTDLSQPGIYNGILDDKNRNLTEFLIGSSYENNPEAYRTASPYYALDSQSVSTVLFYGDQDNLVDYQMQGKRLFEKLRSNNVKSDFYLISGASHDMTGKMGEIVTKTVDFLKQL